MGFAEAEGGGQGPCRGRTMMVYPRINSSNVSHIATWISGLTWETTLCSMMNTDKVGIIALVCRIVKQLLGGCVCRCCGRSERGPKLSSPQYILWLWTESHLPVLLFHVLNETQINVYCGNAYRAPSSGLTVNTQLQWTQGRSIFIVSLSNHNCYDSTLLVLSRKI